MFSVLGFGIFFLSTGCSSADFSANLHAGVQAFVSVVHLYIYNENVQ